MVQRSSFKRAVNTVVAAVLCVLLLQVDAGADEPGPAGQAAKTTVTTVVETTLTVETTLAEPPTTLAPPPTTEPPTTVPPTTEPPTTLPPTTEPPTTEPPTTVPPTTLPPPTVPPTTVSEPVIGPNTLPPVSPPPSGGSPSMPAAIGAGAAAISSGATAAFKSAVRTLGSTATSAARRLVLPTVRKLARIPAVRKLAESQPVAATKRAVMFVTEELSELKPSRVAPYLWLALLALLVSCGAFLRLWWAPVDWPSTRSLTVGAHRRAGQQPRHAWLGWPATAPPRRSRRGPGWQPLLPAAAEQAAPSRSRRIGIDVGRLRSLPPAGKPVFTGDDDPDLD